MSMICATCGHPASDDYVAMANACPRCDVAPFVERTPYESALIMISEALDKEGNYGDCYPSQYATFALEYGYEPAKVGDWAHRVPVSYPDPDYSHPRQARGLVDVVDALSDTLEAMIEDGGPFAAMLHDEAEAIAEVMLAGGFAETAGRIMLSWSQSEPDWREDHPSTSQWIALIDEDEE